MSDEKTTIFDEPKITLREAYDLFYKAINHADYDFKRVDNHMISAGEHFVLDKFIDKLHLTIEVVIREKRHKR